MHTAWKAAINISQVKKLTQKWSNMSTAQGGSRIQGVNALWIRWEHGHLSWLSPWKTVLCGKSFTTPTSSNEWTEYSSRRCAPSAKPLHDICHTDWCGNQTTKKNHLYQNNFNLAHSSFANRTQLTKSAESHRCGRQFRGRSAEATRCFHSVTLQSTTLMKQIQLCFERYMAQLLWPAEGGNFPTPCQRSMFWEMGVWFTWYSALTCGCAFRVQLCQEVAKQNNLSNGTWNVRVDRHKITSSAHGSNIKHRKHQSCEANVLSRQLLVSCGGAAADLQQTDCTKPHSLTQQSRQEWHQNTNMKMEWVLEGQVTEKNLRNCPLPHDNGPGCSAPPQCNSARQPTNTDSQHSERQTPRERNPSRPNILPKNCAQSNTDLDLHLCPTQRQRWHGQCHFQRWK